MAINYTTINEMADITSLTATDKLLIARGSTNGYTTYSCTLQALSNAISCDVTSTALTSLIIDKIGETVKDPSKTVPSYNIFTTVNNKVDNIASSYIDINSTGSYDVKCKLNFTNALTVPNITDVASGGKSVVNCNTLTSYVASNSTAKDISNKAPTSFIYEVVASAGRKSGDYENQDPHMCVYKADEYTIKSGIIIHRCSKDCTAVITTYSTDSKLVVFGCEASSYSNKKDLRADLAAENLNGQMHWFGAFDKYYSASSTAISVPIIIQAKKYTYLCFFRGVAWDKDNCIYNPSVGSNFNGGDVIRIDEY